MHLVTDAVASDLLSARAAIDAVAQGLAEEAKGTAAVPVRTTIDAPGSADWLRTMPAILSERGYMGVKVMYSLDGVGVSYVILLVSLDQPGRPVALVDANVVTMIRTAATAAVATDALVSGPVDTLSIVGTGSQALALVESLCEVRDFGEVRVFSRTSENRQRFVAEARSRYGIRVAECGSLTEALTGADVVGSAIRAGSRPIFDAAALTDVTHLNALSSVRPSARELGVDVWRKPSYVVVDHPEDALESGDIQAVLDDRTINYAEVPSLSDVVGGRASVPRDGITRTVFKSVGSGIQDVSVAALVYEAAAKRGSLLEVGGFPAVRGPGSNR